MRRDFSPIENEGEGDGDGDGRMRFARAGDQGPERKLRVRLVDWREVLKLERREGVSSKSPLEGSERRKFMLLLLLLLSGEVVVVVVVAAAQVRMRLGRVMRRRTSSL